MKTIFTDKPISFSNLSLNFFDLPIFKISQILIFLIQVNGSGPSTELPGFQLVFESLIEREI
jgi:hypothetical protein